MPVRTASMAAEPICQVRPLPCGAGIARAAVEDRLPVEADRRDLLRIDLGLGQQLEHGRGVYLAEAASSAANSAAGHAAPPAAARMRSRSARGSGNERCARSFHARSGGAPRSDRSAASMPSTDVPLMSPTMYSLRPSVASLAMRAVIPSRPRR